MKKRMLPIGTIVKLKSNQLFMIGGYPEHSYEYSAFQFPVGYTGTLDVFQFDGEKIEEIIALGYQDQEQMMFQDKLLSGENGGKNNV